MRDGAEVEIKMIKVAFEVLSIYGLAIALLAFGLFAFITMIVLLIKNWRTLIDE